MYVYERVWILFDLRNEKTFFLRISRWESCGKKDRHRVWRDWEYEVWLTRWNVWFIHCIDRVVEHILKCSVWLFVKLDMIGSMSSFSSRWSGVNAVDFVVAIIEVLGYDLLLSSFKQDAFSEFDTESGLSDFPIDGHSMKESFDCVVYPGHTSHMMWWFSTKYGSCFGKPRLQLTSRRGCKNNLC